MAALFALDSGKAVLEIAAIQIPLYNLFDMGTKEAVYPFNTIFIDLLQGFKMTFDAMVAIPFIMPDVISLPTSSVLPMSTYVAP